MERRRKKEGFLERTAQVFDIPGEAAGLPRVELTGRDDFTRAYMRHMRFGSD